MNTALEVTKDVYWVGAKDKDIKVFDIIMYTDFGTTYNSYLVRGSKKTALIDISKEAFFDQFIERISTLCEPNSIDYIIANHTEPDHTGSLAKLLELNPTAIVYGSLLAIKFLKQITNKKFKFKIVKDGDTLSLGDKTLTFYSVPYLHWPDSIYTYLEESSTLFTCDSFGAHFCDDNIFNDLMAPESKNDYDESVKYYYDCIMSPFNKYVFQAMEKIKDLDINYICTGHGPVIRTDVEHFINLYRTWSTPVKPEKPSVVIPFVSSYGYTKKMAESISSGIESKGDIDVHLFDLVDADKSTVMKKINDSNGVIFGSCTILNDLLPPVSEILGELNPIIHQGMLTGAFGSYGWSGEAVDNIESRLKQLKFDIPLRSLKICFNPDGDDLYKCFEYGEKFADEVKHIF